jgi:hypothetical protein
MQYERRPERPVHYLGVSRCIPAIEQSVLRGHFKSKTKKPSANLNEKNLGNYILEKAEWRHHLKIDRPALRLR